MQIGSYPTPITRLGGLWIKRDDLVSPIYGGNKVRKLERLFADARASGKHRIVTIGAAGSHQIVAASVLGSRAGFSVEAVIVAQPASDHARENLRITLAHGLRPIVAASWVVAAAQFSRGLARDAYAIPLGGSNPQSTLGYVEAARELAAQVRAGELPEPDVVVVALGSGGTAAGLAVGLHAEGLKTRVVGVAISEPLRVVETMARTLARRTAMVAGLATPLLDVDRTWLGRGYGHATLEGERATAEAARFGLVLDATYTAKAFAAALARGERNPRETVVYWHTLSSAPTAPLLEGAPPLPSHLEALFRHDFVDHRARSPPKTP